MNTTLAVVVSAIVILVTALVVITIFSGGAGQIGSITNAQSICQTQGRSSCLSTGQLPLTWEIPTVSIPASDGVNIMVSCSDERVTNCRETCENCNYPKSETSGGSTTTPKTIEA